MTVDDADTTRLGWWLDQGAEIICGGSFGDPKAPLKINGDGGGSYHKDAHTSLATIPQCARSYGLRFTASTPQILLDVDIKNCPPDTTAPEAIRIAEMLTDGLPETYVETSPSGGRHYVYERPHGWRPPDDFKKRAINFDDGSGLELFVATGWCRTAPSPQVRVDHDRRPAKLAGDEIDALVRFFRPCR